MKRWLYIHGIAMRHFFSLTTLQILWETKPFWRWVHLRWLGGMRWGEHFWDLKVNPPKETKGT